MGFSLTQDGPSTDPVSRTLAKLHLEYTPTDKDGLIDGWITAARELAEDHTGRAFGSRACVATWDAFPPHPDECDRTRHRYAIRLPVWPVTAVASVKYYDAGGTQRTLTANTDYFTHLPHMPSLVYPAPGKYWPVVQCGRLGGVEVAFTAGHTDIPEQLVNAVLLTLDYWFKNRGGDTDPTSAGTVATPEGVGLPAGAIRLLNNLARGLV